MACLVIESALVLVLSLSSYLNGFLNVCDLRLQVVAIGLVVLTLGFEVVNGLLHLVLLLGLSFERVLVGERLVRYVLEFTLPCTL